METNLLTPEWSHLRKITFRFFFVFFGLYIFPFPLNLFIPVGFNPVPDIWEFLVSFVGNDLIGIEDAISSKSTGSGDKMYNWIQNLIILVLGVVGCISWTAADFKRKNYELLYKWFMVFVTYYLAYYMFVYGIIKLFYLQFGPPNLERLFQTFGQASPMRLMWTFMGFSESYTMFAGFSETMAGLFLIFRRTRTLGGLVAFGVMLNVFMMNMSYDIPVKLFSFNLMIMGLYVGLQDYQRLLSVFILNEPAPADESTPLFNTDAGRAIFAVVQGLLILFMTGSQIFGSISARSQYGINRAKAPLYGVYNVNTFISNNDTLPPLTTDTLRWERMLMDYPQFTSIMRMDGKVKRYQTEVDTLEKIFTFHLASDTVNKYPLSYKLEDGKMTIDGVLYGDTLKIHLENYPIENFGLLKRGFNWINEMPYNRYNYD